MEELLNDIGIHKKGTVSKSGAYVIDIKDSAEYGRFYSLLDKCDFIEELYDNAILTVDEASIIYANDDYQINLLADFSNDEYRLVVNEL